ncbi:MAG: hypothetical protein HY881_25650 [Deltaproteobacteria bacterium]|nr:hypothetical protein [Deltaproteobacteria bacterium]
MNKPIRTTVVFALVSGLLALPLTQLLGRYGGYPAAFKWVLWMYLSIYALLLARWSRTRLLSILFPLALLLGAVFWPGAWIGFLALALGVLCWVRSGICFSGTPIRALSAELITLVGGITLVGTLGSGSMAAWPLGLCLFILVQALYFYIIPADIGGKIKTASLDPFEHARHEAEKVLAQLPFP